MLNSLEMKILKTIAENQLVTKPELVRLINGNASGNVSAVETAAKGLVQKKLLTTITPLGSTCFIITQEGIRLLRDSD